MRYPLHTYFSGNAYGIEYAVNRGLLYGNPNPARQLPNQDVVLRPSSRLHYPVAERVLPAQDENGGAASIRYQLGVGVTFEPGIWAIDPESNIVGFTETLLHLTNFARRTPENVPPDFFRRAVTFSIYGDEVSIRLYGRLGFHKTHEEPVKKYGSNWWQLEMSGEEIEHFWNRLSSERRGGHDAKLNDLRATLNELLIYFRTQGAER